MAELIASLKDGTPEQTMAALTTILRNTYATGRSSRGILRQVVQLCSSSDTPVPFRALGYEILWTVAAAIDGTAYRGLQSLAKQDMLTADHPDLSIAALATLQSLPAHLSIDLMMGEDADRTMADAMSGDAQSHVRAASIRTFSRIAMHAWMQVADTRPVGCSRPFESHQALLRARTQLFDKCCEVLKATGAQCEDPDADVAGAAFAALRNVLESGPFLAAEVSTDGSSRMLQLQPLAAAYLSRDALASTASSDPADSASAAARPYRAALQRVQRELCRRLAPRFGLLVQRLSRLRPAGRAHALRVLTLILAHAVADAAASTGPLDTPAVIRMDHAASTADQPLAAVAEQFVRTVLVPHLLRPLGVGGVGSALAASASTNSDPLSAPGANTLAALVQMEAARCMLQLFMSFSASSGSALARSTAGQAAAADLDRLATTSSASRSAAAEGSPTASAMASGALTIDSTDSYVLTACPDAAASDYEALTGSLWPSLPGQPILVTTSQLGVVFATLRQQYIAIVLSVVAQMLRRVHASASGAGVVVSTAGLGASASAAEVAAAAASSSTSSPTGADTPAVLMSSSSGLGNGAGSSLLPASLLERLLFLLVRSAEIAAPALFLRSAAAVIREVGRLPDAVIDDPGTGFDHNMPRMRLLVRMAAMSCHVALHEASPEHPLVGVTVQAAAAAASNGEPSPSPSTLLARILYEATKPLQFSSSPDGYGAGSTVSAGGDARASEISVCTTRFRAECAAAMLQAISRSAPTTSVLGPLALSTTVSSAAAAVVDPSVKQLADPAYRVRAAERLHVWLAFALDTAWFCLWLLDHRLTYAGVSTMPRDDAAAVLARVMGAPDTLTAAPAPVPVVPPALASVTGIRLGQGPEDPALLAVIASLDVLESGTSSSSASQTPGQSTVTGWAWAREYEAVTEASDALLNCMCTVAALLSPPPTARTYLPGAQQSAAASLPTVLGVDMLPPLALLAHKSGLQRLLHQASRCDLSIMKMYELERAALSMAPKVASSAASAGGSWSASVSRGASFDALPSALPLQLRLLWLLTAAWDGTDGGAASAGIVAAGTSASLALSPEVAERVSSTSGGKAGTLSAVLTAMAAAERRTAGVNGDTAEEDELYTNTVLSIEAQRQKRLATLAGLIASEAGAALGIGGDLETAASRALAYLPPLPTAPVESSRSVGASLQLTSRTSTTDGADARGEGGASGGKSSLWSRGSKIGKVLGFFGAAAGKKGAAAATDRKLEADAAFAYTGEGTVAAYAHFWLQIDMLANLASSQRCTAGLIKRAIECMLVQPKLSPDVAAALTSLLPRLCLWTAAYGRSTIASELHRIAVQMGTEFDSGAGDIGAALRRASDSTAVFASVVADAAACKRDPWSLSLYRPSEDPSAVADVTLKQQLDKYQAVAVPDAPASAVELLADMMTTPTLALIAAAALPDLTQNVTLGLNRSAASGARMRTAAAVSAAHAVDTAAVIAQLALHCSPGTWRRVRAPTPGVSLPVPYFGSVPAEAAVGCKVLSTRRAAEDATAANIARVLQIADVTVPESEALAATALLSAVVNGHPDDLTLRYSAQPSARGAVQQPLSVPLQVRDALLDSPGGPSVVVSSSSDPFVVTLGHTLHPAANRMTLHISVANATRLRLPPGLKFSLQLGGPLVFERSSITSAMIASSSQRLGSATGAASSVSMGSASAGQALQGELVTMQRGSQHHATHTIGSALPPGCVVSWDVSVTVSGFGSSTVRCTVIAECVTALSGEEEDAGVAATVRSGKAVGVTAAEDAAADDDADLDWASNDIGMGVGGCTGTWALDLSGPSLPSSYGDGLVWTGSDLSNPRKGKLLSGVPTPSLSITRTSANRVPGLGVERGGGQLTPSGGMSPSPSSAQLARQGSADWTQNSPGGRGRRPSGTADTEGDATSAIGGGTADDDAGSIASGMTGGGGDGELDVAGSNTSVRPYSVRRLEVSCQAYRILSTALLHGAPMYLPPALALALTCGVDILPGSASAFAAPREQRLSDLESGSVTSLRMAPLASLVARLPYPHYAVATTRTFSLKPTGDGISTAAEHIPMASPAWLPAVAAVATQGRWSRVPVPVALGRPAHPRDVKQDPAAEVLPLTADGFSQVAFSAKTWAGACVLLLCQARLVPCGQDRATWQAYLQLRADDARVRAALTAELPELVQHLFGGQLSVSRHGHTPLVPAVLLSAPAPSTGGSTAADSLDTAVSTMAEGFNGRIDGEAPLFFESVAESEDEEEAEGAEAGEVEP